MASKMGFIVTGTTRLAESSNLRKLDVTSEGVLVDFFESEKPDAVIYAAGWTWVDGCERDPARSRRENHDFPIFAAKWCHARGVKFIFYSTSYVFDGRVGNYKEADAVSPINVYGRDKADAERAILDVTTGSALILRLICVWGQEVAQKNFFYQVLRAAETGAPMVLPIDQCGNPTWAGDVAEWTLKLIEAGRSGIWHLAGANSEMTRPEWAKCIARGLNKTGRTGELKITECSTRELGQAALRPLLAGMNTEKVQAFHAITCRSPEDLNGLINNFLT
jgi:dTDP-4-dehydrorhamnose reductase